MTVGELIDLLKHYNEDAEVRWMGQPSYPFEYSIEGVCQRSDFTEAGDEDEDEDEDDENVDSNNVFLCEGDQIDYGDSAAWDHC
jgi:hypothetical protein